MEWFLALLKKERREMVCNPKTQKEIYESISKKIQI